MIGMTKTWDGIRWNGSWYLMVWDPIWWDFMEWDHDMGSDGMDAM